eukprot:TRINITY_DN14563_c0_g1_i2.p2 TRINITY_DN14563_c0_g1~~TRINITY_DN14563_c0_g1_i2.p2  ORF type:complete len:100 (-),score=8.63 TRINITY_DN14563_c0_g1_i2:902-1201(-)
MKAEHGVSLEKILALFYNDELGQLTVDATMSCNDMVVELNRDASIEHAAVDARFEAERQRAWHKRGEVYRKVDKFWVTATMDGSWQSLGTHHAWKFVGC